MTDDHLHYAAIVTTTEHIPGDERSRTHPSHGYPAHDISVIKLEDFGKGASGKAAMERWLQRRNTWDPPYKLIRYEELEATTTVAVSVATKG